MRKLPRIRKIYRICYHDTEEGGYFSSSFTTKLTVNGEPWNGEYCLPVTDSYSRGTYYYRTHRCVILYNYIIVTVLNASQ